MTTINIPFVPSSMLDSRFVSVDDSKHSINDRINRMNTTAKVQPTKDQMLASLRYVLWAFADTLHRVYLPGCAWAVLGLDKAASAKGKDFVWELEPEQIDISKFAITSVMDDLYEYGINGRWDVNNDWVDLATDTEMFLLGLPSFGLLEESGVDRSGWRPGLDVCLHVLRSAVARWMLDEEEGMPDFIPSDGGLQVGFLTLGHVALLANMDEKSVRNAANPKTKDPLKTFSHGSRTYVNTDDAKDWLSRRRGFIPTQYIDRLAERDLAQVGFRSATDIGTYLRTRREKLGKSHADVVATLTDVTLTASSLEALEHGEFVFNLSALSQLGDALGLNKKDFVTAAFHLYQKIERRAFEDGLQQEKA
jgi:hypothetical protein